MPELFSVARVIVAMIAHVFDRTSMCAARFLWCVTGVCCVTARAAVVLAIVRVAVPVFVRFGDVRDGLSADGKQDDRRQGMHVQPRRQTEGAHIVRTHSNARCRS